MINISTAININFSNLICSQDSEEGDTKTDNQAEEENEQEVLQDLTDEIETLNEHLDLLNQDKQLVNQAKQLDRALPPAEKTRNTYVTQLEKKGYRLENEDVTKGIDNLIKDIKGLSSQTEKELKDAEEMKAEIINKKGGKGGKGGGPPSGTPTEYVQDLADSTPIGFDDTFD